MTGQQILTKAIQKAIEGGWDDEMANELELSNYVSSYVHGDRSINDLIFNHQFAKALWGDTQKSVWIVGDRPTPWIGHPWKLHLQQMVIADDPIKFLGEHLDG